MRQPGQEQEQELELELVELRAVPEE